MYVNPTALTETSTSLRVRTPPPVCVVPPNARATTAGITRSDDLTELEPVPLFLPVVGVVVIAVAFPEARLVDARELELAEPLGALPEVLRWDEEAERASRGQALAVRRRLHRRSMVFVFDRGERDVCGEAVLGVGDCERRCGLGLHSFASSRQWTPLKCASKRHQRVTQWMSVVSSVAAAPSARRSSGVISVLDLAPHAQGPRREVHVGHSTRAGAGTSRPGTGRAGAAPGRSRPRGTLSSAFEPEERHRVRYTKRMDVGRPRVRAFVRVAGGADAQRLSPADGLQRRRRDRRRGRRCPRSCSRRRARLIAPLVVWRRGDEDFLLLTEPELGETVRAHLARMRLRARCEIEREEHTVRARLRGGGQASRPSFKNPAPSKCSTRSSSQSSAAGGARAARRIEAGVPRWGYELDDRGPPRRGRPRRATHVSFSKGCYPGQEPIARLHYRGHVNRSLRVVELDEGTAVERVTSQARGRR